LKVKAAAVWGMALFSTFVIINAMAVRRKYLAKVMNVVYRCVNVEQSPAPSRGHAIRPKPACNIIAHLFYIEKRLNNAAPGLSDLVKALEYCAHACFGWAQ
jgi:hypothetical protein